jgi:hypothetical protein
LISKQLSAATSGITGAISGATSGITGATSGITGAITTATKVAGVATTVAKITGGTLSSPVAPAPVVPTTKPVVTFTVNKKSPYIVYADNVDTIFIDWAITGANTFTVVDTFQTAQLALAAVNNPGTGGFGPYLATDYNQSKQNTITVTATNNLGTTIQSIAYSVVAPAGGPGTTFTMTIGQSGPITESQIYGRTVGNRTVSITGGPPGTTFYGFDHYFFQPPEIDAGPERGSLPFTGAFDANGVYSISWRSGRHVGSLQVDYKGTVSKLTWDFIVEGPDGH